MNFKVYSLRDFFKVNFVLLSREKIKVCNDLSSIVFPKPLKDFGVNPPNFRPFSQVIMTNKSFIPLTLL